MGGGRGRARERSGGRGNGGRRKCAQEQHLRAVSPTIRIFQKQLFETGACIKCPRSGVNRRAINDGRVHPKLDQLFLDCVPRELVRLVHDDADGRELLRGHLEALEDRLEDFPVRDADADVGGGEADGPEEGDDCGEELRLGLDAGNADDVHVPLVVLAAAPAGRALVPPALRARVAQW